MMAAFLIADCRVPIERTRDFEFTNWQSAIGNQQR